MKKFFVTFGDLLIDYYLEVVAQDEKIVRAWMMKKSQIGCWCRVASEPCAGTKPLTRNPVELGYSSVDHI